MTCASPRMRNILSQPSNADPPRSRLQTPRVDPSTVQAAAGSSSDSTARHQNHFNDRHGPCKAPMRHFEELQRKMISKCSPPRTDPISFRHLDPPSSGPIGVGSVAAGGSASSSKAASAQQAPAPRRGAQKASMWAQAAGNSSSPTKEELRDMQREMKVHSFPFGKQAFQITGGEDLNPTATKKYVKSDAPPSAAYGRFNDRRQILPAHRGDRREGNPQLMESPDMSHCMRPQSPAEAVGKGRLGTDGSPRFRPVQLFQDGAAASPPAAATPAATPAASCSSRAAGAAGASPQAASPAAASSPAGSVAGSVVGSAAGCRGRPSPRASSASGYPTAASAASPPAAPKAARPALALPVGSAGVRPDASLDLF